MTEHVAPSRRIVLGAERIVTDRTTWLVAAGVGVSMIAFPGMLTLTCGVVVLFSTAILALVDGPADVRGIRWWIAWVGLLLLVIGAFGAAVWPELPQ